MKYIYVSLIFLLPIIGLSQESKLTGKVIDKSQNFPLEYATISILNPTTNEVVEGGVTNTKGEFSLKVEKGTYNVKIEYISFESKTFNNLDLSKNKDLGTIKLGIKADSLDEVVVTAETTTVDVRLDKKIYNIGKDLTTSGATISDALANVPSVTVDVDGAINLRGNNNVRILINGKPSAIAGFGSTDVLQQLPAEAIEKVEVITSPSARYDAEGSAGILNIVLKRDKTLGFNGSVRANIGTPLNNGINVNANARTDRFNFFTNIGYTQRQPPGNAVFENNYFEETSQFDRIFELRDYDRDRENFNVNIGSTYFFNDTTEVTVSYFNRMGDDSDLTNNNTERFINGDLASQTIRIENELEEEMTHQFAVNFEKRYDSEGHRLTADFQYAIDDEKTTNLIEENEVFLDPELIAQDDIVEENDQTDILIQADYVRPMGDAQFEAGFRGNYENEVTDFRLNTLDQNGQLVFDDTISNIFDYDENVTALYTQYGNKIGKFSFLLGLRYEHTQLKGETTPYGDINNIQELLGEDVDLNFNNNFSGLFPTVNLNFEIGEDENITLGYNRRINRPRGWFINPFPSRSSRTNIFQGNPSLNPAFSNAFDLGYLKRFDKLLTLNGSVYYQRETDSFERIQEETGQTTSDGIPIIRSIPINLSSNERYGAEIGVLYNPTDWWRLNGSFNYFKFISEGQFNGRDFGAENESFFGRFSSKIDLPWEVQWQTNAFYRGPRENAQTKTDPIASLDLAFSKDFLNDNATISLNVRDLFNSRKRQQFTVTEEFTSNSEFQWRERQITMTLVYRFNQNKRQNRGGGGQDYDDDGGY
ncbi:outer membrane beta-barrel family protein [Psychroflexus sp. ALD_RP9]|uniref:outer membrane beta-barrel family protein n=1 Tax=Psychroflexus sp. ALD_RP9 TaxID=2777186 RepID=UPI001F5D717D|nr:outer membrane beta-barrel family protein [Psychroflexus sp. ALD_RP9]